MATVKTKQGEPKLVGSQARFVCEAKSAGDHTRYSCTPDSCMRKRGGGQIRTDTMADCQTDSRYSKAADESCMYQKGILVQKRVLCRWAVSFPDENVFTTDGKGICRSSCRKSMRCPRRLRVPSLNKIAQTVVRPSSLYGNFAQRIVSGI